MYKIIIFIKIFSSFFCLIYSTKNLKTPSNMFIVNLALSDMIFSLVMGFPLLTISAFNKKWIWGNTGKRFCHSSFYLFLIVALRATGNTFATCIPFSL